jgi:hypothetical protein
VHLAGLAAYHAEDGRVIVVEGAMAVEVVTAAARRVSGIGMASAFLPCALVHIVGLLRIPAHPKALTTRSGGAAPDSALETIVIAGSSCGSS